MTTKKTLDPFELALLRLKKHRRKQSQGEAFLQVNWKALVDHVADSESRRLEIRNFVERQKEMTPDWKPRTYTPETKFNRERWEKFSANLPTVRDELAGKFEEKRREVLERIGK